MMSIFHGLWDSGRVWGSSLLTVAAFSMLVAVAGQTQTSNPGNKPAVTNTASGSGRVVLFAAPVLSSRNMTSMLPERLWSNEVR